MQDQLVGAGLALAAMSVVVTMQMLRQFKMVSIVRAKPVYRTSSMYRV